MTMDFDSDFEDGYAHTSYGSIYFKRHWNDGPSLVMLHGLGADVNTWRRVVQFMPESIDLYLVDLLGHGRSDKPRIDYTIRTQVDALNELAGIVGVHNFFLLGHSYGGWIAAYYAMENAVRGLILEDAAGLKEYFDYIRNNFDLDAYKRSMAREVLKMNGNEEHVVSSILDVDFGPEQLTKEGLSSISSPTVVMWGAEDSVVPVEYGRLLNRYITGSRLIVVDGAGHEPHYTIPEEAARKILDFINDVDANG